MKNWRGQNPNSSSFLGNSPPLTWLLKLKLVLVEKEGRWGRLFCLISICCWVKESKLRQNNIPGLGAATADWRYLRRNEWRRKVSWCRSAGNRGSSCPWSPSHGRSWSGGRSRGRLATSGSRWRRSGTAAGRRRLPVVGRWSLRLAVGRGGEGRVVSPHLRHASIAADGGCRDVSNDLQRLLAGVVHPQHLLTSQGFVRALLHHTVLQTKHENEVTITF